MSHEEHYTQELLGCKTRYNCSPLISCSIIAVAKFQKITSEFGPLQLITETTRLYSL